MSLNPRQMQIKAIQRDKDETKADLERDKHTFTLDAPGSVSEKTQIVAAASHLPAWEKTSTLLSHCDISASRLLLACILIACTWRPSRRPLQGAFSSLMCPSSILTICTCSSCAQMCVFLALCLLSATEDSWKSFIHAACVFAVPLCQYVLVFVYLS